MPNELDEVQGVDCGDECVRGTCCWQLDAAAALCGMRERGHELLHPCKNNFVGRMACFSCVRRKDGCDAAHHRDKPVGLAAGAPLRNAADAGGGSSGRVLDQRSSDPVRKKPLQQGPA